MVVNCSSGAWFDVMMGRMEGSESPRVQSAGEDDTAGLNICLKLDSMTLCWICPCHCVTIRSPWIELTESVCALLPSCTHTHTHTKFWVLSFDFYYIYTVLMIFSTPNPKTNPHLYHIDKLCTFIISDAGDLWFIFLTFTLLLNCSWSASVWRHTLHDWDSIPLQHMSACFPLSAVSQ